jgi:hypothetical protein
LTSKADFEEVGKDNEGKIISIMKKNGRWGYITEDAPDPHYLPRIRARR